MVKFDGIELIGCWTVRDDHDDCDSDDDDDGDDDDCDGDDRDGCDQIRFAFI